MSGDGAGMEYSPRVYQAQGVVAVRAGCSMSEALALMKNTAQATGETLESIAAEVLNHAVRFD
jgi:AmiR/NasT family two-component response regulator